MIGASETEAAARQVFQRYCSHDALLAAEEAGGSQIYGRRCRSWISTGSTFPGSWPADPVATSPTCWPSRTRPDTTQPLLPLMENIVARLVCAAAGIESQTGPMTCVADSAGVSFDGSSVAARLPRVAWACVADQILVLDGKNAILVDSADVTVHAEPNAAGEAMGIVEISGVRPSGLRTITGSVHELCLAALTRAASMCGAIDRCAEMTVEYAHQRHQFGRPIARFQAVQAHLAGIMAEEAYWRERSSHRRRTPATTPTWRRSVRSPRSCATGRRRR